MGPGDGLLCGARDQFWWRSREPTAGTRGARGDSRLRARPRAIPVRQARSQPDLLVASVAGVPGRSCYLALFVEPVSVSILYHEGAWGLSDAPSRFFCG